MRVERRVVSGSDSSFTTGIPRCLACFDDLSSPSEESSLQGCPRNEYELRVRLLLVESVSSSSSCLPL